MRKDVYYPLHSCVAGYILATVKSQNLKKLEIPTFPPFGMTQSVAVGNTLMLTLYI